MSDIEFNPKSFGKHRATNGGGDWRHFKKNHNQHQSRDDEYDDDEKMRIKVYWETVNHCKKEGLNPIAVEYDVVDDFDDSDDDSDDDTDNVEKATLMPPIIVEDKDTLVMAKEFSKDTDAKVCILNMASIYKAGGGVESGKPAQEEELYRRTSLAGGDSWKYYNKDKSAIPTAMALYTPYVQILRYGADRDYKFMKKPVDVSVISIAALKNPKVPYKRGDRETMEIKIDGIFEIAKNNGVTHLVLGAFGCGAYGNPPDEVCKIFANSLGKYAQYFKKIGFAVLAYDDRGKKNLEIFKSLATT